MDVAYLKSLAMSGSGFVFDPRTGHSFTTNPSGLLILKGLQQGKTLEEIVAALRDELLAPDSARTDVQHFFCTLADLGWIAGREMGAP